MNTENEPKSLSSDKPLDDPSLDRLGYAPFAKRLADSICHLAPTEGFVMALFGPWGSGKTTTLSFIRHYLEELSVDQRPIMVHFNPWWFAGHEDIARKFLMQFQATLSARQVLSPEVIKNLERFTKALSEAPVPQFNPFGFISNLIALLNPENKDILDLKNSIAAQLREEKKQILVVVDDIDRLTSNEIRQLFRSIKALADFPYVTYLMAFDKGVVTEALGSVQGMPGEQYLEKIVQAPFELPLPDKVALRGLLTEQLNEILLGTPDEYFDAGHWSEVFSEGIDDYIQTPRDVVRLINALSVTYPTVIGEVNSVDFFAIETLRVFDSEVYDIIRRNPNSFTGRTDSTIYGPRQIEDLRTFHDGWLNQQKENSRERLRKFIKHLFPKLDSVWGKMGYAASYESSWRRKLQVCSEDIFPVYFRMAVPEGEISNTEMQATLALSGNERAFSDKLLELSTQIRHDGTTRIRPFLERLQDYTSSTVTVEQARSIITSLLVTGDRLIRPEDEPRQILETDIDLYITRVIYQLLLRIDEEERFEIFQEALQTSESLFTVVHQVDFLVRSKEKAAIPADELITEAHEASLKAQALLKIQNAGTDGSLKNAHRLMMFLYRWEEWGEIEDARAWVSQITESDDELIEFFEKTKNKSISGGGNDATTRVKYEIDVGPFFDKGELLSRASNILDTKEDLSTEMRDMLVRFIERKGGGPWDTL